MSPVRTCACTNIPGRRRPPGLSSVAWTCTLRVASSTTASIAVIRPVSDSPARPSAVTCTSPPTRISPTLCWGTEKFTWTESSDCRGTIGAPPSRYWPRLTCRIPRTPVKGARICLRSMVARISPTRASACLSSALTRSSSAWARIPCSTSPRTRSRLRRARSRCASAAASWARSCRVSRRTRISPSRTGRPDSNPIDSTTPGRSALTVTPRTAWTVPMAPRVAGHSRRAALMVVTASGGGWKDDAWAAEAWICRIFTAPRTPTPPATAMSTRNMRLVITRSSACLPWPPGSIALGSAQPLASQRFRPLADDSPRDGTSHGPRPFRLFRVV